MRATTEKLAPWVVKSACGRELDAQLETVENSGQHGAPQVLRAMALAANGFAAAPPQADLALIFGCYRPFSTPDILREVAWIFQTLGVSHTWLEKENCCGLPMLHQVAAEDKPQMLEKARGYVRGDTTAAAQKGATRLAYCCAGCAQAALGATASASDAGSNSVAGETPARHDYILDVLLDSLAGRALQVAPIKVAYFEGCHTSYKRHFSQVDLNWQRYRQFLDSVAGLTVVDIARGRCCKMQPESILAAVQEAQADALVCACSGCNGSLKPLGRGKIRVMSYTGLLAQALGGMPATL